MMSSRLEEKLLNPSFGDALFMGLNPQVMQMVNAILGIEHDREERNFRHQQADREYGLREKQFARQQSVDERNQQDADTDLQLKLHDAGARKGNAALEDALTKALGAPEDPRALVKTRFGDQYLPTERERRRQFLEQKRAERGVELDAEEEKERRRQLLTTTEMEIPGVGKVRIPNGSVPTARKTILEIGKKKFSASSFQRDDDGNITFVGVDADTGEKITVPFGRIGTTKSASEKAPPHAILKGRARTELLKERGISDPSAWVDNPAFADALAREIEADKQAAQAGGYDPSSPAEIERRVERKLKVARKIRAGDAITDDMVEQKAAEIYGRGNKTSSTGGSNTKPASGRVQTAAPIRNYMTPAEYQKLIEGKSPAQKADIDNRLRQRKIEVK
jgi:hypothetical protein